MDKAIHCHTFRHSIATHLVERSALWAGRFAGRRTGAGAAWGAQSAPARALLGEWPVPQPASWSAGVNEAQTAAALEALRRCVVVRSAATAGWRRRGGRY